jgi:hypothetical protein
MIELMIAALLIGDYICINRENVFFALQCAQNKYLRRNELK